MTKKEIQIIKGAVQEWQKVMLHYYEEGKQTGLWKDHEIACEAFRAIKELARSLGVES